LIRRDPEDEDAVSAAIATVLLFAGVISIISGMMVSVMPVIDELHGAVERETMEGQLRDHAAETGRLAETGVPGDSAELQLRPHTGRLSWQMLEGGSWYSATHQADSSFRIEGALDLDDSMRFRHPEHRVETLCASDLHASAESLHHHRIPILNGTLTATPMPSLTAALGDVSLSFEQGATTTPQTVANDGIWTQSDLTTSGGEAWIHSDAALRVLMWRGQGGAFLATPDQPTPGSDKGRAWSLPLLAGTHGFHLESEDPFTVNWNGVSGEGSVTSSPTALSQSPAGEPASVQTWSGQLTVTSNERLVLRTSADARLVVHWGDASDLDGTGPGAFAWPDRGGAWTGTQFHPPAMDGSLILSNPDTASTTARIGGLHHSIAAQSSIRIPWSAASPSWVEAAGPISIEWLLDDSTVESSATHALEWRPGSLSLNPASDTGRTSGADWIYAGPSNGGDAANPSLGTVELVLQPAGPSAAWSMPSASGTLTHGASAHSLTLNSSHVGTVSVDATSGSIRLYTAAGGDGLTEIPEDGQDRCVNVDMQASGWVEVDLPWVAVGHYGVSDVRQAWRDGSHYFGLEIILRGTVGDEPHVPLGSAWAFHLPRLVYNFESSVSGLEIASQGGFVGTNHPEYRPDVLVSPVSREGPGPRLAATVPVTLPTTDSLSGSSGIDLTLTLDARDQVVSMEGHEIRRGWEGFYGEAIAAQSAAEVDFSADWLTFPGRLDLLNDYVGWVQPSPTMAEVVYHAGGEPIHFNLQFASLSSHSEGSGAG
jgi:hypothetical protein